MNESLTPQNEQSTTAAANMGLLNWKWMLGIGILLILLGTAGLGMSFALTMATAVFFGVLLIVSGIFQIVNAFGCKGGKGIVWQVLIGLLYLVAGIATVKNPAAVSALLTAMLSGMLIAVGIFRVIFALTNRDAGGWLWLLLAGIGAIILGALLLSHWPVSGLFAIGLFIAIEILMQGWTLLLLSLAARKVAADPA